MCQAGRNPDRHGPAGLKKIQAPDSPPAATCPDCISEREKQKKNSSLGSIVYRQECIQKHHGRNTSHLDDPLPHRNNMTEEMSSGVGGEGNHRLVKGI